MCTYAHVDLAGDVGDGRLVLQLHGSLPRVELSRFGIDNPVIWNL